jgi:hypothetical protein
MVQIVPPLDWTPGEESEPAAVGSAAATTVAATAPAPTEPFSHASLPLAVSRVVPSKTDRAPAAKPKTKIPAPVETAPSLVRPAPISPLDPSETAAATSRWFWPTFSAATFVALAVAGLVIYFDRHNAVSADAGSSTAVAQSPSSQPIAAPEAATPSVPPAAANSTPTIADKSTIPSAPTVAVTPVSVPPVSPPTATNSAAAPPLAVARVPPPKSDSVPPVAATPPAPVKPPAAGTALDAFALQAAPPAVAAVPVAATPVAAAPQPLARASLLRVPPRNVDVDARLSDPVAAVEFHQSPLCRFLADLSQLSTVPISLDIDALSEMNLSADMPISVQLKNTTLAGILDESLAVHELAWRAVGHQIEIGRAPAQGLRRVRYSIADLAGDTPESRRQFAAMVHSLVEPAGWSEANGSATSEWSEGALMVTADPPAHAQLIVLCEKLHLARGLPLKSRIDPGRFHLDTRTAHAKASLDALITVNFAHPEALARILAYLQSATRLNLLVDNVALAADGMSADSEGALVAQQQPVGAALTSLLDPMELTYRVIDDRTIEITTSKAAARHAEVEFYPAADLPAAGTDGHELIARIKREISAAAPAAHADLSLTIEFDAPSKYLIVRAPQSVQHRVESLLGTWRVAKQ